MDIENIKRELKETNLLTEKIDTRILFPIMQRIANELRNEYEIARFEGKEDKINEINSFLYKLVLLPPIEIEEGYIEQKAYGYVYNQLTKQEKQAICSLLYDPRNKDFSEETLKFYEEYISQNEQYAEIVLISLFYLYF